jgi:hypothetical protein
MDRMWFLGRFVDDVVLLKGKRRRIVSKVAIPPASSIASCNRAAIA